MKLNTINIRLVTFKRLHDVARSHVPNKSHFITTLKHGMHELEL
jgi:hypothetical protein